MGERLDSWKDIAAYLGREVRTVQRWAIARALPIHRLPGGNRPRVFSTKSEIDAWIQADAHEDRAHGVSVAVLRFLNLAGSREDQYFADGLAEDVIDALVRIPGLRVIARTSSFAFTSKEDDVRNIGAQLGATWLLEGSIRRDGQRVRVSAQLVSSRDGVHAWSQTYDRQLTDLFAIQDDIARAIAGELKVKLSPRQLAPRMTDDAEAYHAWLKGRSISQQYTPESLVEAQACYEAAIARDPRFARPHFGIADLLFHAGQFGITAPPDVFPRARQAIARALDLDDRCGEAHALQGTLQGLLDYDWRGAERSFDRAFELSPGSAGVLDQHAWYHLTPRMQVAQAVEESEQAVSLDPLSPWAHAHLSLVRLVARQPARAAEEAQAALALAPGFWWLHWFYGTALLYQGKLRPGFRECQGVYETIRDPLVVGGMAGLHGLFLRRKKARQLLSELEGMAGTMYVPPFAFALAYLGLGDDRVFEWLDKSIDARDPMVTHLPSMPLYDGIRDDPRFRALLARMHLA